MTATTMAWERAGLGDPLVLLHGIGTTHDDFAAVRAQLAADYEVLAPDLPGHGQSPPLRTRPTVAALTDVVAADLDALGLERVHLLGNSLGARIALELAWRGRARSVVAIAPSGMQFPLERAYQGLVMGATRANLRVFRRWITPLAGVPWGRTPLLATLRARPWDASETEARAVQPGFAEARRFWATLWWAVLADVPTGLGDIDCPVVLAQGTADWISGGQTPRFLAAVPGSVFRPLFGAGHAPQSDAPATIVSLVHEATSRAKEQ
ncbi:alpha/beta fold hydrolase [Actinoplanes sp. URMC 104]|uniref:alpha/beta fold hydrolase n=1 Tax=Actinoplanes sp. URMC 104 TaxID=3423409 RepID=UPI003F1ABCCA